MKTCGICQQDYEIYGVYRKLTLCKPCRVYYSLSVPDFKLILADIIEHFGEYRLAKEIGCQRHHITGFFYANTLRNIDMTFYHQFIRAVRKLVDERLDALAYLHVVTNMNNERMETCSACGDTFDWNTMYYHYDSHVKQLVAACKDCV